MPTPILARPPLPPRIAEVIDQHYPAEEERAELAEKVPEWLSIHVVERIINVILEMAAARRDGVKIGSLASYAEGTMKNWEVAGKCTMRHAKTTKPPPKPPEQVRAEAEAELAAKREAKRLAAEAQAREKSERDALEARWHSLPGPDREAIRARVKAANPAIRWENMLHAACLTEMGGAP